jgi:two-component system, NarL family, sensor kinase
MLNLFKDSKKLSAMQSNLEFLLLEQTAELRSLSQQLLKVQDNERRRLSRDLHDSTGQTLVALKLQASLLEHRCRGDATTSAMVRELTELADQAIAEIRTMSYLLHPPLLDEVGFACAAQWFVEGFAKRSGIIVSTTIEESRARMPERTEIVLFRVLQESLTNVHRHSGATSADVTFQRRTDAAILEVHDSGCGIPAERLERLQRPSGEGGVGLAGMRARLLELNGVLDMESNASGTLVRAWVPLGMGRSGAVLGPVSLA